DRNVTGVQTCALPICDGDEQRLVPALFGIFGHGNVAGLSQALAEHGSELPYYQPFNEQSMVHTAAGYAKATYRRATLACTSSIEIGRASCRERGERRG